MDYHSIFLFQGLTEADIDQMEHGRCLRRKAFARRPCFLAAQRV